MRKVTAYPFKKGEPAVLEAIKSDTNGEFPGYADGGPRLFDFSKMRRSQEGLRIRKPPGESDPENSDCLLVALVGDCLVEPFWPEGLGIIRGFFSALDAAWAVQHWAEGCSSKEAAGQLDKAYTRLKTVSAATRQRVMQGDEKRYG